MLIKDSPETGLSAAATSTPEKLHRNLSVWNSFTLGFAVRDRDKPDFVR